ncbi:MAG TPA: carotenoid biosynthesis protein [Candidatus Binatia bacterium]|nr:carotenoid biosynthesis protein [Candidatus Binatia bacterium]
MDLLIGTFVLRPYVFGFLAAFLLAGTVDLGVRRTLLFVAWVGPLAWLAEFSSTRTGIPFGLYHYTETTRGQEMFIANVPFMDCLSFTFLAYAAFCLARVALSGRSVPGPLLALVSGVLMMLLDVVIDPLAVRGDRWFLGRIFFYPDGGIYFGVPLSNFAGWVVVGTLGVGGFIYWSGWRAAGLGRGWPVLGARGSDPPDQTARRGRPWPGVALYYVVFGFNLGVTVWIGEWVLLMVGATVHLATALVLWSVSQRPAEGLGLEKQQA